MPSCSRQCARRTHRPQLSHRTKLKSEWSKMAIYEPAFEGAVEFDMTVELLGNRITRKAKAVYEYTPEWEHLDTKAKALRIVDEFRLMYHIEILAVPEEFHDDGTQTLGKPYWVMLGDL